MRSPVNPSRRPPGPGAYWRSWLLLVGFLLVFVWMLESRLHGQVRNPKAVPRAVTPREALKPEERATIALFRQASPSVVFITTLARQRNLFSLNMSEMPQGSGSGFIWDQEGHIITNFHVIQDASGAKVTLADHSEWDAQLVGAAPDYDL